MKQRILALVCALVLLLGTTPSAAALTGEAIRAADTLSTLGIIDPAGDPDVPATRVRAVVLAVRLAGAESAAAGDNWISGFRDVPPWAENAVNYAAHQKWVSGVTPVDFKPYQTITANGWCTILLRMLGYRDSEGAFSPGEAALFARHIGLVSTSYDGPLTWGQVCQIAASALTFLYKGSNDRVIDRLVDSGTVSASAANALGLLTEELAPRQAADRYMSAAFCMVGYRDWETQQLEYPDSGASGFFISPDGLAVTNYHALELIAYADVTLVTGEEYPVERVIWYDVEADLAVIQVSRTSASGKTTSGFAWIEMTSTEDLRCGDTVHAIGNPLSLGLSVTTGIISALGRKVENFSQPCIVNTADISQGSSGGVLMNVYGQAIGVTSGAYVYGNSMYLAIPLDLVLEADLTAEGWTLEEVRAMESK